MEDSPDLKGLKRKADEAFDARNGVEQETSSEIQNVPTQCVLTDERFGIPFIEPPAAISFAGAYDFSGPPSPKRQKEAQEGATPAVASALTPEILQKMKLPMLKQELRNRGLKVSGNKPELIHRLLTALGDPAVQTPAGSATTSATASASKSKSRPKSQLLKAGVPEQDIINTDLAPVRKELNAFVKDLAKMVNLDWHDGYEEQSEEVMNYFHALEGPAQAVYNMSVIHHTAFDRCHEVMKVIGDTWMNMHTIPFRCALSENFDNGEDSVTLHLQGGLKHKCTSPDAVLGFTWRQLLAAAAADTTVDDATLLRYVKDAVDHGCLVSDFSEEEDEEDEEEEKTDTTPTTTATTTTTISASDASETEGEKEKEKEKETKKQSISNPPGKERLMVLYESGAWRTLPSTAKRHKQRRAIDRRFDGPKHLRTRDFGSDDEDGDNERCCVS